jgi:hypothetical protein
LQLIFPHPEDRVIKKEEKGMIDEEGGEEEGDISDKQESIKGATAPLISVKLILQEKLIKI